MFYRATAGESRKIKVVLAGGLGDHLLATPFIRYFRHCGHYDSITCAYHAEAEQIFDTNPHIDLRIPCAGQDLFVWALPEKDCDVFSPYVEVVALESRIEGIRVEATPGILSPNQFQKSIIRQVAEHHGIELPDEKMEIHTTKVDERLAQRLIPPDQAKPVVYLNVRSHFPQKELPLFVAAQIASLLSEHCELVQRNDTGAQIPGVKNLMPDLSIRQTAALFKRLACVLTVDSFPGHLATAVGTPAVVLFGPSNPVTFGHTGNINLRPADCPICADTPKRHECTSAACMASIDAQKTAEAVLTCLSCDRACGCSRNQPGSAHP